MKKSLLLFIPMLICLTGCQEFKIGIDYDKYSSGLDKSLSSQNQNDTLGEYHLFGGDVFDTAETTSVEITFGGFTENLSNITDIELLNSYITCSEEGFFTSVESPKNIGVKKDNGLFVGADSKYTDGVLGFVFSKNIKYVKVTASPYYYINTAWNEDTPVVDEPVGISLDNSHYVPLVTSLDEAGQVKDTDCKFDVSNKSEDKNKISLRVKQKRAILKKITLYY